MDEEQQHPLVEDSSRIPGYEPYRKILARAQGVPEARSEAKDEGGANQRNPTILAERVTVEKCRKYIGHLKKVVPKVIALEGGPTGY